MSVRLIQELLVRFKQTESVKEIASLIDDIKEFFQPTEQQASFVAMEEDVPALIRDLPVVAKELNAIPATIEEIEEALETEAGELEGRYATRLKINTAEHAHTESKVNSIKAAQVYKLLDSIAREIQHGLKQNLNKIEVEVHTPAQMAAKAAAVVPATALPAAPVTPTTVAVDDDYLDGVAELFADDEADVVIHDDAPKSTVTIKDDTTIDTKLNETTTDDSDSLKKLLDATYSVQKSISKLLSSVKDVGPKTPSMVEGPKANDPAVSDEDAEIQALADVITGKKPSADTTVPVEAKEGSFLDMLKFWKTTSTKAAEPTVKSTTADKKSDVKDTVADNTQSVKAEDKTVKSTKPVKPSDETEVSPENLADVVTKKPAVPTHNEAMKAKKSFWETFFSKGADKKVEGEVVPDSTKTVKSTVATEVKADDASKSPKPVKSILVSDKKGVDTSTTVPKSVKFAPVEPKADDNAAPTKVASSSDVEVTPQGLADIIAPTQTTETQKKVVSSKANESTLSQKSGFGIGDLFAGLKNAFAKKSGATTAPANTDTTKANSATTAAPKVTTASDGEDFSFAKKKAELLAKFKPHSAAEAVDTTATTKATSKGVDLSATVPKSVKFVPVEPQANDTAAPTKVASSTDVEVTPEDLAAVIASAKTTETQKKAVSSKANESTPTQKSGFGVGNLFSTLKNTIAKKLGATTAPANTDTTKAKSATAAPKVTTASDGEDFAFAKKKQELFAKFKPHAAKDAVAEDATASKANASKAESVATTTTTALQEPVVVKNIVAPTDAPVVVKSTVAPTEDPVTKSSVQQPPTDVKPVEQKISPEDLANVINGQASTTTTDAPSLEGLANLAVFGLSQVQSTANPVANADATPTVVSTTNAPNIPMPPQQPPINLDVKSTVASTSKVTQGSQDKAAHKASAQDLFAQINKGGFKLKKAVTHESPVITKEKEVSEGAAMLLKAFSDKVQSGNIPVADTAPVDADNEFVKEATREENQDLIEDVILEKLGTAQVKGHLTGMVGQAKASLQNDIDAISKAYMAKMLKSPVVASDVQIKINGKLEEIAASSKKAMGFQLEKYGNTAVIKAYADAYKKMAIDELKAKLETPLDKNDVQATVNKLFATTDISKQVSETLIKGMHDILDKDHDFVSSTIPKSHTDIADFAGKYHSDKKALDEAIKAVTPQEDDTSVSTTAKQENSSLSDALSKGLGALNAALHPEGENDDEVEEWSDDEDSDVFISAPTSVATSEVKDVFKTPSASPQSSNKMISPEDVAKAIAKKADAAPEAKGGMLNGFLDWGKGMLGYGTAAKPTTGKVELNVTKTTDSEALTTADILSHHKPIQGLEENASPVAQTNGGAVHTTTTDVGPHPVAIIPSVMPTHEQPHTD